MYIALIVLSAVIFSVQIAASGQYSRREGGLLHKAMLLSFLSGTASCVLLLLTNREWMFTWFSFAFALISALACVTMTWCGAQVLTRGDLSMYTLFSQMGGMIIPSVVGILFYAEPLTWQRAVCIALVTVATIIGRPVAGRKAGEKKQSGLVWYLAVFALNGVWCVFAKIHQSAPELAVSGPMYSLMIQMLIVLLSGSILLPAVRRNKGLGLVKPRVSCPLAVCNGVLNTIGNLILLEALLHVDASIQYPIATGGIMVLTVLIDYLFKRKPPKRTLISTGVAVIGLVLLAL